MSSMLFGNCLGVQPFEKECPFYRPHCVQSSSVSIVSKSRDKNFFCGFAVPLYSRWSKRNEPANSQLRNVTANDGVPLVSSATTRREFMLRTECHRRDQSRNFTQTGPNCDVVIRIDKTKRRTKRQIFLSDGRYPATRHRLNINTLSCISSLAVNKLVSRESIGCSFSIRGKLSRENRFWTPKVKLLVNRRNNLVPEAAESVLCSNNSFATYQDL